MGEVKHESRAHALLSASKSEQWINCTVSPRLQEKFAESKTSVYAEEGTLAHEFGQINIQVAVGQMTSKAHAVEIKRLRKHRSYNAIEMEGEVSKYTEYVLELFATVKRDCPDAILLVEERLDFSYLVEGGFGTGDICIIADGVLYIIDLKYGKGIRVSAEDNSQLKLYGLGALRKFEMLYDIHTVELIIVQPRLDHIDSWRISTDDLHEWAETIVKPKAILAYQGKGEQVAGSHCKFCTAKPMCRAFANQNLELAKHDFRDPHLLDESELLAVYEQIPMLQDWATSVSAYILETALKGKVWPGYKIVEGRSVRKWLDENKVIEKLTEWFDPVAFTSYKLKGIGEIEKLVGKADFTAKLGDLVIKPQGPATLAPEADKRPPMAGIEAAKEDFK